MNRIDGLSCRRVSVEVVSTPSDISASDFFVKVRVKNESGYTLDSGLPCPIHLAYHWLDPITDAPVLFEGIRTPLGPPLPDGFEYDYDLRVGAPPRPGQWKLRVTLLQEWVQWFDDAGIEVFADHLVEVQPIVDATPSGGPPVLQLDGKPDRLLLIGCLDTEGTGGLYSWDGQSLERIDPLGTSSVATMNGRLMRLPGSDPAGDAVVMSFNAEGFEWCRCLPGHGDAHFLAEHDGKVLCVSTSTNSIIWLDENGRQVREWKAPGEGDARHINSVYVEGDKVFVSAFGRFTAHREWNGRTKEGTGIVFDLDTDCDVLSGLCAPHNPVATDGTWIVCNSVEGELLVFDRSTKQLLKRLALGGWARGIALSDYCIFVGISAQRYLAANPTERSSVVIIDRFRHVVVDRLHLPALEIGGLCLVDPALKQGVMKGWHFLRHVFGLAPV